MRSIQMNKGGGNSYMGSFVKLVDCIVWECCREWFACSPKRMVEIRTVEVDDLDPSSLCPGQFPQYAPFLPDWPAKGCMAFVHPRD